MGRKLTTIIALGALALACGGCFLLVAGGAAAGAGAATYYMGEYRQTFEAPLASVYDAALASLEEHGLEPDVEKRDGLTGRLEADFADGKRVWIELLSEAPQLTKVSVRVGLVPHQERARLILRGIEERLDLPEPSTQ